MNRSVMSAIVVGAIGWAIFAVPSPSSATTEAVWGDGTAANVAGGVRFSAGGGEVRSMVCSSPGNCTAAGEFTNAGTYPQAFTMTSTDGVWSEARPVEFGFGVRYPSNESEVISVACATAGACAAIGLFQDVNDRTQAFITTSDNGAWTQAAPVVFPDGVLFTIPRVYLTSVSCASAGNCTAVGRYWSADGSDKPFTITSTAGVWGAPTTVVFPNGTVPTTPYFAVARSVSCSSAGNCAAVGHYALGGGYYQAYTVTSTNGTWGPAQTVAFPPNTLNANAEAELVDVSCASDGECTAVGYYADTNGEYLGFTVTSNGGQWATAQSQPADHLPYGVSCVSAGNCTAVGDFTDSNGRTQAYAVTSTNGQWGAPVPVTFEPGVQNTSPTARLDKVSCGAAGSCTAIGFFINTDGDTEGFTVTSSNDVWGVARPVVYATGAGRSRRPGGLRAVSCTAGGLCSVGGRFTRTDGYGEIFVMSSQEAPPPPTATPAPEMPAVRALTMAPATSATPSTTLAPTTTIAPTSTLAPATTVAPSTMLGPPSLDVVLALPPASTPLVADGSALLGEAVTVSLGGFAASEYVQLVVASTPQVIGSGYADTNGVVALTGTLPSSLSAGAHTLAVYAPGSGVGFSQSITVTTPTLPSTGTADSDTGAWLALCLLLAGLGVLSVGRRRQGRRGIALPPRTMCA